MTAASSTTRWWHTPIVAWAAVGTVWLAAGAWVMARWAATDGRWFPSGDYGLSPAGKLAVVAYQALAATAVVVSVAWAVVGSVRRRGITVEAMVLLGFLTATWLMPVVNYGGQTASHSKYLIGTTDWGPFIPGWHGPNPNTHPEALFVGWLAFATVLLWVLPTVWVLRAAVRRWPGLSGPRLVLVAFGAALGAEIVLEPVMVILGGYAYVSAVPSVTLFAGHWYQIPLYATVIAAVVYGVIPGLICHYHDHHPRGAPVLRGIQALPRVARPWVATAAVIGVAQVSFFALAAGYAVITALAGVPATDVPAHLR